MAHTRIIGYLQSHYFFVIVVSLDFSNEKQTPIETMGAPFVSCLRAACGVVCGGFRVVRWGRGALLAGSCHCLMMMNAIVSLLLLLFVSVCPFVAGCG